MDTVSDTKPKEYNDNPGMRKLTATIKRLVKPWFGSGRTVIADSWFGSISRYDDDVIRLGALLHYASNQASLPASRNAHY